MLACSTPGNGGRPVCSYGQAKLAARLGVPRRTLQRLVADLREPGTDERHPGTAPAGLRLGWLLVLPREHPGKRGGGRIYGGNRYVLQVDVDQLAVLEQLHLGARASPQASEQLPSSDRSATSEASVSPGQTGAPTTNVALQFVTTSVVTGVASPHPESEPAESDGQQPTRTNALAWEPPGSWSPEHRAAKVRQALARIRAGLTVRTGQPDGLDPATREPRARSYLARVVAEDLAAERARLHSGESPPGYRPFGADQVAAMKRREREQERLA